MPKPETSSERYILIGWYFRSGLAMTTAEAAKLLDCSRDTALRALYAASAILPIYCERGIWRCLPVDADVSQRPVDRLTGR